MKQLLISLATYPEATGEAAIQSAANLAAALGASLTGIATEVDIRVAPNALADMLLDVRGMVDRAETISRDKASLLGVRLGEMARDVGVAHVFRSVVCTPPAISDLIVGEARLHDLTILPLASNASPERLYAEEVVFSAGRPVLILPDRGKPYSAPRRAVVAWDYSRAAARALADALPLLRLAGAVHVTCVTDEKDVPVRDPSRILAHLASHGVAAAWDGVRASGRSIQETLRAHVADSGAELLVMGAFGHSRFRQFVLGGATKGILDAPQVPTLLSH